MAKNMCTTAIALSALVKFEPCTVDVRGIFTGLKRLRVTLRKWCPPWRAIYRNVTPRKHFWPKLLWAEVNNVSKGWHFGIAPDMEGTIFYVVSKAPRVYYTHMLGTTSGHGLVKKRPRKTITLHSPRIMTWRDFDATEQCDVAHMDVSISQCIATVALNCIGSLIEERPGEATCQASWKNNMKLHVGKASNHNLQTSL
jgi:hypothetical protein